MKFINENNLEVHAFRYGTDERSSFFNYLVENNIVKYCWGYCVINYMGSDLILNNGDWFILTERNEILVSSNQDFRLDYEKLN